MQKDIKFLGLDSVPDDYQAPDGQLDMSYNLLNEDGHLRPLFQPNVVLDVSSLSVSGSGLTLHDNNRIVFIHNTSIFKHYIVNTDSNKLYWVDSLTSTQNPSCSLIHDFGTFSVNQVNAIGNTLLVLCNDGIHYILWKDNDYLHLGTHIPELPISFGLQGQAVLGDQFTAFDYTQENSTLLPDNLPTSDNDDNFRIGGAYIDHVSGRVIGAVNKFIADKATKNEKFVFPFFVRYAYRLFDGSLSMHSSPVLMVPNSHVGIMSFVTGYNQGYNQMYLDGVLGIYEVFTIIRAKIGAMVCDLDYACNSADLEMLQNWKDIVKSVDIFISTPFYTFDQNGDVEYIAYQSPSNSTIYSISKTNNLNPVYTPINVQSSSTFQGLNLKFVLPESSDRALDSIKSCSSFYLLSSIEIEDLHTERTKIHIKDGRLETLASFEAMTDDYDSHDLLVPSFSFVYNQRLNISNLSKSLAQPFNPAALVTLNNNYHGPNVSSEGSILSELYLFVRQDGKEVVLKSPSTNIKFSGGRILYLFFNNPNATKAVIKRKFTPATYPTAPEPQTENPQYQLLTIQLKLHDNLNGSYFFDGWNPQIEDSGWHEADYFEDDGFPSESDNNSFSLPNKLYSSELNNPFFFPVTGINSIGTGTILVLSSAAKALSQGQFGQFPLYAFCSDGVWAIEVSSTGTFSAKQPITRDVCINPKSITQLDDSVLFTTDRGIMQIIGSSTVCISDNILSDYPIQTANLYKLSSLTQFVGTIYQFLQFMKDCQMVYDYTHQRIIVYNPKLDVTLDHYEGGHIIGFDPTTHEPIYSPLLPVYTYNSHFTYAYVFSLKSKNWGMMRSNIASSLNSYPDALAMTHDNKLVSFSNLNTSEPLQCLFVTRPINLKSADTLKTINTIVQHGMFQRGAVKTILYGSRDLFNWHLVASSTDNYLRCIHGTPYKYFRIATIATLSDRNSISSATIEFTPKHTNNIR